MPLESYHIIQAEEGSIWDYLMAALDLVKEMHALRLLLQQTWQEVAYDGLNSAVAGALCHAAHARVQRTSTAMFVDFVDFPGGDTFETVMNTLTMGDIENGFSMTFPPETVDAAQLQSNPTETAQGGVPGNTKIDYLDLKEHFFINTYRDLVEFAEDFQKTRSGKPTKRMLEGIKSWDPEFNLQRATDEERIQWRRIYTINWLYDLVNVHSSVVVQRNAIHGEGHALENVDWSPEGPWAKHRTLFGLNRFAGKVPHHFSSYNEGAGWKKAVTLVFGARRVIVIQLCRKQGVFFLWLELLNLQPKQCVLTEVGFVTSLAMQKPGIKI